MVTLSTGLLGFLVISALAVFVYALDRSRLKEQFSFRMAAMKTCPLKSSCPAFLSLLFFLVLYGIGFCFHLEAAASLPWFLLGFILPWALSGFNIPAMARGALLLVLSLWATTTMPVPEVNLSYPLYSLLWGLMGWKVSTVFDPGAESQWEDVLLPMIWLVGLGWINAMSPTHLQPTHQGMLAGFLGISLLLSLLQGIPLPVSDKIPLKAVLLAVSGGLAGLLLFSNVLLAPGQSHLAWLYALGIFLAGLLQGQDEIQSSQKSEANGPLSPIVLALGIIGIGTLVAARLAGTLGWLIFATAAVAMNKKQADTKAFLGWALLFWLARILLQGFIQEYNLNVTGINLTHPYATAAMYGAITLMLLLPPLLNETKSRGTLTMVFLAIGSLVPICANFFLHAEATGSLLVVSLVAALTVTFLGTVFYPASQQQVSARQQLLWIPTLMLPSSILASDLLEIGNYASRSEQFGFLGAALAVWLVIGLLIWKLSSRSDVIEIS